MKSILCTRRVTTLLFLLFSISALAQKTPQQLEAIRQKVLKDVKVQAVQLSEERQTPSVITLKAGQSYSKAQAKGALASYLGLRSGTDNLVVVRETAIGDGMEVVEFQQYYKGIKVEHGIYKALVRNGQVRLFNGAWYEVPQAAVAKAGLEKTNALSYAKQRIGAKKWATDALQEKLRATSDARARVALQNEIQDADPKGELVYVKNFNKRGMAELRLAYKFNIYAAEPLSRDWVYVDAANGSILLTDAIIKHAGDAPSPFASSVSTTVQTRYSGARSIKVKQVSGADPNSGTPIVSSHPTSEPTYVPGSSTWLLMDDTRGNGIETYDLNGVGGLPLSIPSLYAQGKSFTDADNNWTVAEHKRGGGTDGPFEAENDDIAWDAHWGASMVYDYWKTKQYRLSYDGKNAKIKSFVHYGPAYDNAFWNGTAMTYGDGSGPAAGGFKALTSLDVCGHEIGHGVCEFTSNLVYEKESGAMNEAFSDIWAACVEHYVITSVDPSLGSIYRPFYIGEQIGATLDAPLRRMDNPKAAGNPDTYGGVNWSDPNCTPDLTNDYCSVHNNSGLLNKWFYLLTVGSGAGSGPNKSYARTGSDDGVNDKGQTYSVTGVGFATSERIAYLTELLLTPTATYAEAREMSIAAATDFSGSPCSPVVESVTNAWYAIGVGAKFVKPCSITYGFVSSADISVNEASTPAGCTSQKSVTIPVLLPPNSTLTLGYSGTAYGFRDFTHVPSSGKLYNTTSVASKQNITINILNDAAVEPSETIALKLKLTNLGTAKADSTLTITIMDDDVAPVIGTGEKTLLSNTFTRTDGFADPTGWTEKLEITEGGADPAAYGKNQWGIFGNGLAITGKEGLTGTQLLAGTYNNLSQSQTYIKSPAINAKGLNDVKISFTYKVQGEVDALSLNPTEPDIETLPVFDYMAVMYSLDGVSFTELNTGDFRPFASTLPTSGTFTGKLPAEAANRTFYIAFRWSNDANAGGPQSVSIDNLTVKGAPKKLESTLGSNSSEKIDSYGEAYFYSVQDGGLIGHVKHNAFSDYKCTNAFIEKAGTSSFTLFTKGDSTIKAISKIVRIVPTADASGSNTATLYFTEAEIKALETATGKLRSTFFIYKVNGAGYNQATSSNTKGYKPTYTAISGVGGQFRITYTDVLSGSYALGTAVKTTATVTKTDAGIEVEETGATSLKFGAVYPNPGSGRAFITVMAPKAQKLNIELVAVSGQTLYSKYESVAAGTTIISIPVQRYTSGTYMIRTKGEDGNTLNTQPYVKK
jgi:Zn-dependent metalloprotease